MGLLDDLYAEISDRYRKIEANNAKISRLNTVKKEISDKKDEVKNIKKDWSDSVATPFVGDYSWYGTNKKTEADCAQNTIVSDYQTYIDNIDSTLDAICDKITALENENNSHFGAIGWLNSRINSILNEIEKCCN